MNYDQVVKMMNEEKVEGEAWIERMKHQYPDPAKLRNVERSKLSMGDRIIVVHPNEEGGQMVHLFKKGTDPEKRGEDYCLETLLKRKVWEYHNYTVDGCRYIKEWGALGYVHIASTDLSLYDYVYTEITPDGEFKEGHKLIASHYLLNTIHTLVKHHDYNLIMEGYDQEEEFTKQGIIRTTHPKVAQRNDGLYVAGIYCSECGGKTSCICEYDFYELLENAFNIKWYCWPCSTERYIKNYEANGPPEKDDYLKDFKEFWIEVIGPDEAETQGLHDIDPLEYAKANMEEFTDYYMEQHEGLSDDEIHCDCPLGI